MEYKIEHFGKSHWSLFLALAYVVKENNGNLDWNTLRLNPETHPFVEETTDWKWSHYYQTKPNTNWQLTPIEGHDDFDVMVDLKNADLVELETTETNNVVVTLTLLGNKIAKQLVRHKNTGALVNTFIPNLN